MGRLPRRSIPLDAWAVAKPAVFTGAAIANGSIEQLIRHVPADAAIAVYFRRGGGCSATRGYAGQAIATCSLRALRRKRH